jgi:hypothetical protein
MNSDPDPFEQGQRAARQNIPAEANPYQDGSDEHALWAAGHEKVAGARGRRQGADKAVNLQPIFFSPFLNRGPLSV